MSQEKLVNKFLSFLGTTNQPTSLKFLNELIKAHQEKIKWETLTKIIDWEKGKKREQSLTSSELNYWITERFCIDKEIYERAIEVFNKKSLNSKSVTHEIE
ncbi:hypothetical protein [Bacillus cereus group sp. MYBK139-2]|uniref:hypothetical protein n=1 Tax=unclassified Bacillus cereus group TaxID=2750818 RepID=UPI003F7A7D01